MDADLDRLFRESKPTTLPEAPVTFAVLPQVIIPPAKPEPVSKAVREKIEDPERLTRTIFVGNVPVEVCKEKSAAKAFKKLFSPFGTVGTMRFRSIGFAQPIEKRRAFLTRQFNDARQSCNSYVVMSDAEAAQKACEALNGTIFMQRHLRLDLASNAEAKPNTKKSIFIGNLPLSVDEEAVWKLFEPCGAILNVRIIRDKETGLGKGIGYVTFKEKATVELAVQLNGSSCGGRPVRISKCAKPGYQEAKRIRREKLAQAKANAPENHPKIGYWRNKNLARKARLGQPKDSGKGPEAGKISSQPTAKKPNTQKDPRKKGSLPKESFGSKGATTRNFTKKSDQGGGTGKQTSLKANSAKDVTKKRGLDRKFAGRQDTLSKRKKINKASDRIGKDKNNQ